MLKYNEPNPLSVFGMRRMDHCPPHFAPVLFPQIAQEKELTDWIWENLTGRFYYGDFYTELGNGNTDVQKCAAFEIHGEASYFALMLPTINTGLTSVF
jgi:hypothetical protein